MNFLEYSQHLFKFIEANVSEEQGKVFYSTTKALPKGSNNVVYVGGDTQIVVSARRIGNQRSRVDQDVSTEIAIGSALSFNSPRDAEIAVGNVAQALLEAVLDNSTLAYVDADGEQVPAPDGLQKCEIANIQIESGDSKDGFIAQAKIRVEATLVQE